MPVLAENKTKLMLPRGAVGYYSSSLLDPLRTASGGGLGIVFPYQPDITYQQSVNYSSYDLVHTNYSYNSYRNTPSPSIQLMAQFSSVTEGEAAYTLAVLHFLRSVTKMWFGLGDVSNTPTAGTPPPVLRFSSFGSQQFSDVRCVVANFSTTYDSNVDLKDYGGQQVPTIMTFAIDLLVQNTPDRQKKVYSTSSFVRGSAYTQGFI